MEGNPAVAHSDVVTISPARRVHGSVRLPGDKSISHRYALLAGIAHGESHFTNFSTGADCASTLACMAALGAKVERNGDEVRVTGRGRDLAAPSAPLDCGNSGSTMRMLAGILAGQPFVATMIGDESLSRRPMARVMQPLTEMGARITAASSDKPPLEIRGAQPLRALAYTMPVPSAQVKSAVLLAGLFAEGETSVAEAIRTRHHTGIALPAFGCHIERSGNRGTVPGGQELRALAAAIPGDISSAAFFLCAAAALPGSSLVVDDVLLNPRRAVLLDVLGGMGAEISMLRVEEQFGELVGTVKLASRELRGGTIAGTQSAALIDELPVLAAIAPYTKDGIEIRDARELRVKESDRIATVAENLRRMGATVEERDDGLRVPGQQKLRGADVEAALDHRIAMAFAVAALGASGETRIHGASAARISYPEFFTTLDRLSER